MQSVIRFLNAEGAKPVEMYTRMLTKYGASQSERSVEDSPRPGQAHRAIMPKMIEAVDDLIRENRSFTFSEIAMEMSSVGFVHTIIGEELHYSEICA
jgi:hypothetical protein